MTKSAVDMVAEAFAAGNGEPRVGRFEYTMAAVAVQTLRDAGMLTDQADGSTT